MRVKQKIQKFMILKLEILHLSVLLELKTLSEKKFLLLSNNATKLVLELEWSLVITKSLQLLLPKSAVSFMTVKKMSNAYVWKDLNSMNLLEV
jgi:hypothetical protein